MMLEIKELRAAGRSIDRGLLEIFLVVESGGCPFRVFDPR